MMELMVNMYYGGRMSALTNSGLIDMRKVIKHALRVTMKMVVCVLGSTTTHMIIGVQIQLVENALGGTHCCWDKMILKSMREQLTDYIIHGGGWFMHVSILCSFFFENIMLLQLTSIHVSDVGMGVPRMHMWGTLMPHVGGGLVGKIFTPYYITN